jgi:predicted ArsR family transcriptional regulator
MPERADVAYRAIAGTSRLIALRYLLRHPESSRATIAADTGLTSVTARAALTELEQLGYVKVDDESSSRQGRHLHYSVNESAFKGDFSRFVAWVLDSNT